MSENSMTFDDNLLSEVYSAIENALVWMNSYTVMLWFCDEIVCDDPFVFAMSFYTPTGHYS